MRQVSVGDRVKIISIPKSVYEMPPDMRDGEEGTLTAFQHALQSGEYYTVTRLDGKTGWPWIDFTIRETSGREAFHSLLLEPGSFDIEDLQTTTMAHQEFKVGDRVRILSIPQSVYDMPPSMRDGEGGTLTIFRYLLDRNQIHDVTEVDPVRGWPWIKFRVREADGTVSHHKLMIEPECVEIVQ